MPANPSLLPEAETHHLVDLGERLRKARLRRQLTASAVAARAGITRVTLHRAERGEPALTVGTIIKVMGVLGLASDFALLARDDQAGRLIQDEQLPPRRATKPRQPRVDQLIRLDHYPQLKQIAWHLGSNTTELEPAEAFALYERNWRHIDHAALEPSEHALIQQLTARVGKGVLLV